MNAVARKKDKLADVVVKEIPDMDDLNDFLVNLGGDIAHVLRHSWEDNSFSYEYWGAKGTHEDWQPILTETVTVLFPTACPIIPVKVTGHYKDGGCPCEDAPRHKCGHQCQDVEMDFEAVLDDVRPVAGGFEAEYSIEPA